MWENLARLAALRIHGTQRFPIGIPIRRIAQLVAIVQGSSEQKKKLVTLSRWY